MNAAGNLGPNSNIGCNGLTAEETAFNGELDAIHQSVYEYYGNVSFGKLSISPSYEVYNVFGISTFTMSLVRTLCGFTDRCVALCSPSWSRSTVCSGVREIGESLILSPDAESPSYKPATPFFHGTCSNINHSPLIDWQGLAEAIAQFKDLPSGTSDYVFGQCDQAALAHAGGSQAALKNNYLTYICTYPFQNVDDLGEPYSEGFTGLAQVGQQGQTCLFFFFQKERRK